MGAVGVADIVHLIGNTPVVELPSLGTYGGSVWAKLESSNPGGSVKDRTAWSLLKDAMDRGRIRDDTVIIEATSGNTGVALAMVCAVMHLRLVVFMPEGQSSERKQLFWAYGATIVETPRDEKTGGAIKRAKELEQALPNSLMLRQHENPANPNIHEITTGPEIWEQMNHDVDVLVCGVGTGGTITGVARYLKKVNPAIEIVAVEPAESAVLNGKPAGNHKIQGIGAGFIPRILDMSLLTRIVDVPDDAAISSTQFLARQEGLVVGLSSGAAYWACRHLLEQGLYHNQRIMVIFPDSGERYLSTGLYAPTSSDWIRPYL
jgi:cysteine synthase A